MSKKIIKVATLGIESTELKKLTSIFWLSIKHPSRQQGYEIVTEVADANFIIVNADLAKYVTLWREKFTAKPAVMLANKASSNTCSIIRPLVATTTLRILDTLNFDANKLDPKQRNGNAQRPSQPKVLVVDDSLPIRKRMQLELDALRFNLVDFADCYVNAMDYIASTKYDMVLLDVILPDGDGYKICKSIKGKSDTKSTIVIMLTGKSSPFDKVKGKLSGCDSYLTKPVDRVTLKKTIQKYFTQ